MERATVYFADVAGSRKGGMLKRLDALLDRVGLEGGDLSGRIVAVKLHFGERGNTAYVRPVYVARIVERLNGLGARPFLTDTCTLYVGSRADAPSHAMTAVANGFDPALMGAPVIIAGGLRGTEGRAVPVAGRHFQEVEIAPELLDADLLLTVTHFKCHEMSGFGGALKNLGMGGATRRGKLAMHSDVRPAVAAEACTGCGRCVRWCAFGAIGLSGRVAAIDAARCSGCGACLPVCPASAIRIVWDIAIPEMQEKMVEYAAGLLAGYRPDRALFVTFVTQVSPLCDCYPFADAPVVPDVGILAGRDPGAIDQAAADLVNARRGLEGSAADPAGLAAGADKFRAVHPNVDWEIQLRHAEALGVGTRRYDLVAV